MKTKYIYVNIYKYIYMKTKYFIRCLISTKNSLQSYIYNSFIVKQNIFLFKTENFIRCLICSIERSAIQVIFIIVTPNST